MWNLSWRSAAFWPGRPARRACGPAPGPQGRRCRRDCTWSTPGTGDTYLVGDPLVQVLFNDPYATWALAAGAAQQAGCATLPDPKDLWRHGIETLGQETFGVPRVPSRHRPSPESLQLLPTVWPAVLPLARRVCPAAAEWPILFGLVAQKAITMGREVIDPCLALRIVMDTAIAGAMVVLAPAHQADQRP